MFDILAGVVLGTSVAEKTSKTTKTVQREVLGTDEISESVGDIASIGIGIATGISVFDMFTDDEE